jgi:hypothetical protein
VNVGVIWATEPYLPAKQMGKIVSMGNKLVYVFDGATIYRRLQALGLAETVAIYMLQNGVTEIHYTVAGQVYQTTLAAAIEHGISDTMSGRKGYLYVPLKHWRILTARPAYPWVVASNRIDLPWRIDAPELLDWRNRIVAARPVQPAQMSLFA